MTEENEFKKVLVAFDELSTAQRELLNALQKTEMKNRNEAIRELNEFRTKRHTFCYSVRSGAVFITESEGTDDESIVLIKKEEIPKVIDALLKAIALNEGKANG